MFFVVVGTWLAVGVELGRCVTVAVLAAPTDFIESVVARVAEVVGFDVGCSEIAAVFDLLQKAIVRVRVHRGVCRSV